MHKLAYVLLWIGGINWGLVGLMDYNLVEALLPGVTDIVYILVGVSALYTLMTHKSYCVECKESKKNK